MPLLLWIILFCLLGGVLSVAAAGLFLLPGEETRRRLVPGMVSIAIGALLGAALIGLLPEALESGAANPQRIGAALLGGILLFFMLEKLVLWRHSHAGDEVGHHHHDHGAHTHGEKAAGVLILVGGSIHNTLDGVLIGAAFMTDIQLGVMTSIAIAAHEIPQEMGDFAILLHSGMRAPLALALNVLVSLTTVVGGVVAYFTLAQAWLPYALALAAASFIYIAVADLIPGLHRSTGLADTVRQVTLIALGVAAVILAEYSLHAFQA